MRRKRGWLGLLASLTGLLAGAGTGDDVTLEAERDRAPTRSEEAQGLAASGPGFYVWDEDPAQARRWAAELAGDARAPGAASPAKGGPQRSPT